MYDIKLFICKKNSCCNKFLNNLTSYRLLPTIFQITNSYNRFDFNL